MKTIGNITTAIGAVLHVAYSYVVAVICVACSVVAGLWKATGAAMAEINDLDRIARGASDFANPPRPAPLGAPPNAASGGRRDQYPRLPKPVPTPPPAAAAKNLPKPVPRPKSILNTPLYELQPDFYGYNHGRKQRGPYNTKKKREEAERQRLAADHDPLQPRADRSPPERLTVKVAPMAIPGRPTGFVTPDRPPRRPEPVLPPPEAGKDGETRIDHTARVAYRKEAGVWTVAQDIIVCPSGVVRRPHGWRLDGFPPPPRALADIPLVYPPPPPGYVEGFYRDRVTGELVPDGWPGPVRQANRENV